MDGKMEGILGCVSIYLRVPGPLCFVPLFSACLRPPVPTQPSRPGRGRGRMLNCSDPRPPRTVRKQWRPMPRNTLPTSREP
eukprot:4314853-Pyramimonas_sp.AAC.1